MFPFGKKSNSLGFNPVTWLFKQVIAADKEYMKEHDAKARKKRAAAKRRRR